MVNSNPRPVGRASRSDVSSTLKFARSLLAAVNPNHRVTTALGSNEFLEVVNCEMPDPLSYDDGEAFRNDYFCYSLLRKFQHFPVYDLTYRKRKAMSSFKESEENCARTNARLTNMSRDFSPSFDRTSVQNILFCAQRKISRVLGALVAEDVFLESSFSGGASLLRPRDQGDPYYKLSGKLSVTPGCYPLAKLFIEQMNGFQQAEVLILQRVAGNRITTVPKSSLTERVIAIEPEMNMFIQKGIGNVIRKKLRRIGIDLNDQTINQRLAREGSITGLLATIDLSAASDSIAWELVRLLLPSDWFDLLEITRSHYGWVDDKLIHFEKVSSMGNGFTFELESLIFWALVEACCDATLTKTSTFGESRSLSVYGDDIICPVNAVDTIMAVFSFCGFTINVNKSFWTSAFRESCGKHYFNGKDVTPLYIKDHVCSDDRYIWLANSVKLWASSFEPGPCDPRLKKPYNRITRAISDKTMTVVRIPMGYGDGALIGAYHEAKTKWCRRSFSFRARTLCPVSRVTRVYDRPALSRWFMYNRLSGVPQEEQQITSSVDSFCVRNTRIATWSESPYW